MSNATCGLCGASGDGSGFCARCGQRISAEPVNTAPPTPAPTVTPASSSARDATQPHALPAAVTASPLASSGRPGGGLTQFRLVAAVVVVALALGIGGFALSRGDAGAMSADAGSSGTSTQEDETSSSDSLEDAPLPEVTEGQESLDEDEPAADDPLGLAAPFVDQDCSGQFLVVLASSGDPAEYESTLAPALREQEAGGETPQYLRTDESCSAFNQSGIGGDAIYAAYLGPFDDGASACQARIDHTSTLTYVKSLEASSNGPYYCLCSYEASVLPDLNNVSDETSAGERRFWMVELQHVLYNEGENPDQLFGGNFGSKTTAMVRSYQASHSLAQTGALDTETWEAMQQDTCA